MEDLCDDDMMSTCELNRLEPISNRITNTKISFPSRRHFSLFFLHSFIHVIPTNLRVCVSVFVVLRYRGPGTNDLPLITQPEF